LLTTIPTIVITPMKDMIDRVTWVSSNIQTTPISPSGTVNMITKGSTSD